MFQISPKDMGDLEVICKTINESRNKLRTEIPESIIAEYINVGLKKDIKANTLKGIIQELATTNESINLNANKENMIKFHSHKEIFDILTTPSDRRDGIFKESADFAVSNEQSVYSKEYSMLFQQVHEKGEDATPEAYLTLLHDLHVFCSRHLLLTLLTRNEEKIKNLSVELYKRLLTFLLIASAEADLMKLAVQNRELSERLNKILLDRKSVV